VLARVTVHKQTLEEISLMAKKKAKKKTKKKSKKR
jgi:hypothetical protein